MLVLLDSKPLGMVTNPKASQASDECNAWLDGLLDRRVRVLVPEIIDYELRRELIRLDKPKSIAMLDNLAADIGYLRLDSETFLLAASMWAEVRNRGMGTAAPQRLDIDCILAAQARQISTIHDEVRLATIDVDDLSRYDTDNVKALHWEDIKPPHVY
jgi:predicted nucleic acid-binding protein